ncbi:MAG: ankyrin repeat domain-containing protein [Chloroflexota bacterium]
MDDPGSALLAALYRGDTDAVASLRADAPELTIFEAAAVGDVGRVRSLVDGDPALATAFAPDGFHALGLAAFFHHPEVVRFLIEAGADVRAPSQNAMRVTALHSAVADAGDSESALALVAAGADTNAKQRHGWTPLHAAAQTGDRWVVEALLAAGADPTLTHDGGKRAADLAREAGHAELAALLEHAPAASG